MVSRFSTVNWYSVGKQLLKHAIIRAGGRPLPQGKTYEDIVATVIEKTITGQRKYDPNKGELLPWLKDQVNSELANLAVAAASRYEFPLQDELAPLTLTPEQTLISTENIAALWSAITQAIHNDPELENLITAVKQTGKCKPAELAGQLEVPVGEVYTRLRRLRRRLEKFA